MKVKRDRDEKIKKRQAVRQKPARNPCRYAIHVVPLKPGIDSGMTILCDVRMYYRNKIDSLQNIFGTKDLELQETTLRVGRQEFPIRQDVIDLTGLGQAPPLAEDIQYTFGAEWKAHGQILPEHRAAGLITALIVSLLLAVQFVPKLIRTGKMMPAGLMSILSVIGLIVALVAWLKK